MGSIQYLLVHGETDLRSTLVSCHLGETILSYQISYQHCANMLRVLMVQSLMTQNPINHHPSSGPGHHLIGCAKCTKGFAKCATKCADSPFTLLVFPTQSPSPCCTVHFCQAVSLSLRSQAVRKVPIPSYLLAIACGNLASRRLGPRSHVWSEPEAVEACAFAARRKGVERRSSGRGSLTGLGHLGGGLSYVASCYY